MSDEIPHALPVVTAERMRALDRPAIDELGISSLVLMENAARGSLESLRYLIGPLPETSIVVLCGKGNNGGDGLALARLAAGGSRVSAFLLRDGRTLDVRWLLRILRRFRRFRSAVGELPITLDDVDAVVERSGNGDAQPGRRSMRWQLGKNLSTSLRIDLPTGSTADSGEGRNLLEGHATQDGGAQAGSALRDGPQREGE